MSLGNSPKSLDWIILLLFGNNIKADELQFGYVEGSNTELATWLLINTVSQYLKAGTSCYILFVDCTKAYDLVKHSRIFKLLLERQVPALIIRIIMITYRRQEAIVRWESFSSRAFTIRNGVPQGAVSSPQFFNLYTCEVFSILRKKKLGARIANIYSGIIGYADDLCLIASTRNSLQKMVTSLESFAVNANITFSTNIDTMKSKTKCMFVSADAKQRHLVPIILNERELPWTDTYKYLGTTISNKDDRLSSDINIKRGTFISNTYQLVQEFRWAGSFVLTRILRIYNGNIYGSNLYDLESEKYSKFATSYNSAIKLAWKLPSMTHRYWIEVLGGIHMDAILRANMINFFKRLLSHDKTVIRAAIHSIKYNRTTVSGNNLAILRRESLKLGIINNYESINDINTKVYKQTRRYEAVKPDDFHKLQLMNELLMIRDRELFIDDDNIEHDDIMMTIDDLAVN